jgi:hypothetical protein
MRAFLEKCDKEWFDDFVYTARQPLLDRGFEIVPFDGTFLDDFISRTSFNENDILVGCVEATKAFWNELGFKIPEYIGYPESLNEFYGRKIGKSSIGEIEAKDLPIFIKPLSGVKEFTGFVLDKFNTLQNIGMYYSQITSDTLVYTSEVIDIVSEYRVFVHKNEIVGIKHYAGDFSVFPPCTYTINEMIQKYKKGAPISYTLDIGILETIPNDTMVIIEINDFWAIGGYGLDGKTYVRMLIDRFQEIKKLNK